ncbi:septum formation inhibitor Maf [Tenacibaculum jejuense]|uniref:Maf-like protein n=1 Tax=Tenacibaculum jejuense TaxID=584609 RepID=A0A238UDW8_9FLAO|nr:septum formation inhibitor Maf [Tenacibaculum jejuense]SNR16674.1 Maf-like protein [Tenacibaculum jejuense]
MKKTIILLGLILLTFFISSYIYYNRNNTNSLPFNINKKRVVSKQTKKYWYDGNAEISSYELSQARYGENHKGIATLIFVTEPFSKTSNTKADYPNNSNIPVLKLNMNKKFNTGIYPYSMMNSTFFPFENDNSSLKISSSIQEWCGMTYVEMKNTENDYTINFNSYFEGASFRNKKIEKTLLEDDLWSLIRLNPKLLPTGEHKIIPSFFFLNSKHQKFKSYTANIKLTQLENSIIYQVTYPKLKRTLEITFENSFPFKILGWSESHESGYGKNKKLLTTTAKKIKTIKVDYWNKNKNKDLTWRSELGIE